MQDKSVYEQRYSYEICEDEMAELKDSCKKLNFMTSYSLKNDEIPNN